MTNEQIDQFESWWKSISNKAYSSEEYHAAKWAWAASQSQTMLEVIRDDANVSNWQAALSQQEAEPVASVPQDLEEFISAFGLKEEVWYGSECVERTYILEEDFRKFARTWMAGHVRVPLGALQEVIRISEREHQAWNVVKTAIAASQGEV